MQKSRPTQLKRQRERAQAEKRKQKFERRQQSKSGRVSRPHDGEDPDIAGIRPGPQPSPYGDDLMAIDETPDAVEDSPE
jgi:hypothetical protein